MILTNKCARERILAGTRKLCNVVGLTLGPKGRNVIIERNGTPLITNDGVTIARHVKLDDQFENIGAQVLLQSSTQTNKNAGDGTTSAIVLGAALMEHGMRAIEFGANPVQLKDGLLHAAKIATDFVEKNSRDVADDNLTAIAIASCQNQADGELVARAFQTVGADGTITLTESYNSTGTTMTISNGCEIDATLVNPLFATDPAKLESIFHDAKIFITDKIVSSLQNILPLMEISVRDKTPLVIIAPDYSQEVTQALLVNKLRAGLTVAPLKWMNTSFATASAQDIAAVCNTEIDQETNSATATVSKIICGMQNSVIIGSGPNEKLDARLELIRAQITIGNDEYSRDRLQKRLAKLTGSIATIHIGCSTEIETKEKKLRIEDAICAVRAASKGGITEGGGMTYIRAKNALEQHAFEPNHMDGARVLINSLDAVTRQIATNAGANADLIISRIHELGYNAATDTYENMWHANIIDPTLVITSVIQNATSATATLLTTDAVIGLLV